MIETLFAYSEIKEKNLIGEMGLKNRLKNVIQGTKNMTEKGKKLQNTVQTMKEYRSMENGEEIERK